VAEISLAHELVVRPRVVLYVRVSTWGQVRTGYSLAQQLDALREYATRAGYEVLEEVTDLAESGVSLRRPGIDRVRDLVAAGGVSVVLAQDSDRLAREPEHYQLLRREFEEKGCRLESLNDLADADDRYAKYEWLKIAERTQRGKLRKAREGKIAGGSKPNYGFRFNVARDGYGVDEDTMRVVRRIFHMVGVEQRALNAVKRRLESEKVSTPTGNRQWATWVLRGFILDDVYKPHAFEEIANLVTPEVAARLDPDRRYGIWWFNRERWTSKQVSEASGSGRAYRRKVKTVPKPKEEWIAVPVPASGVPREVVDAARETVLRNSANSNGGDRFWELSGGSLRCAACGRRMRTCVTRKKLNKRYFYYACSKRREDRDACPNRKSYRAEALEDAVRRAVANLLAHPEEVRGAFEARIRGERTGGGGERDWQARACAERLAELDGMRSSYQEMTAKGLMALDELGARLEELEESRRIVLHELETIRSRREGVQRLKRDRDAILESYAGSQREILKASTPEDRHRVYRMLRLEVLIDADGTLTVSGIPGAAVLKFTDLRGRPGER
jgi:site-specific DNA recombinase